MIIQLNDSDVEKCLESNSKQFLLIDFWTSRCELCRYNAAISDELSKELENRLDVGKINVDESPYTIACFQIKIVPCMALFHKNKLVQEFYGIVSKTDVKEAINRFKG